MTANELFEIKVTYVLYASPADVYRCLTSVEIIEEWSEAPAKFEPFQDGNYSLFDNTITGQIMALEQDEKIVLTWRQSQWTKKMASSVAMIELSPDRAGTVVVITHTLLPSADIAEGHHQGWIDKILEPLNDYLIEYDSQEG
ncbi:MAG: hypothetical protein RIQ89_348 [Bacteroidota bacterium]|jgi:uncharacterized protein YndB with AHSA1/START domain